MFVFDGMVHSQYNNMDTLPPIVASREEATGNKFTDVVLEMDDGEWALIRRTPGTRDKESASEQQFEYLSTGMVKRGKSKVKIIDQTTLSKIAVVPGLPLRLGPDPTTGNRQTTRANVAKIYALNLGTTKRGSVAADHKWAKKPSDIMERFNQAMREARAKKVAPASGSLAAGRAIST